MLTHYLTVLYNYLTEGFSFSTTTNRTAEIQTFNFRSFIHLPSYSHNFSLLTYTYSSFQSPCNEHFILLFARLSLAWEEIAGVLKTVKAFKTVQWMKRLFSAWVFLNIAIYWRHLKQGETDVTAGKSGLWRNLAEAWRGNYSSCYFRFTSFLNRLIVTPDNEDC